jgi:hypothetical protein
MIDVGWVETVFPLEFLNYERQFPEALAMRFPRPRFSVRWMMVAVALVAAGLFVEREFGEGLPPNYVLRGIPARIARLKPGMTRKQVHEILGLKKSWLQGGLSAKYGAGRLAVRTMSESYDLRWVDRWATPSNPFPAMGSFVPQSTAVIRLQFDADLQSCGIGLSSEDFQVPPPGNPRVTPGYRWVVWGEREETSARLIGASFVVDTKVVAEMPDSPAIDPSP